MLPMFMLAWLPRGSSRRGQSVSTAPIMTPGVLVVRDVAEVDVLADQVRASAARLQARIATLPGDGLGLLRALKFDDLGFHPVEDRAINAIEQVNQAWTYMVALAAARLLLQWHPEAGALRLAPGAHAAQPLDVMGEVEGALGAETFAAVDPRNNDKLAKDLRKLAARHEIHRYVFFASPRFAGTVRRLQLERGGVQVWSVDV